MAVFFCDPTLGFGETSGGLSNQSKLIATLKALEFVLKLAIHSRNKMAALAPSNSTPVGMSDTEFKHSVLEVFTSLNGLMKLKGISLLFSFEWS